ncbi:unnamed protein product [Orchesella dallaii]|uniref:Uncharacterized protein n=1 Tax=Orchesella dallaii TaxID=48710 RepID=A0ABP1R2G7_9HEXA
MPIRLRLETNWWKLLPWNFLTWGVIFTLSVGSIIFILIKEIFQPSSRITALHIGIYFSLGIFTLISWGVCLAFRQYWAEIVSAFNELEILEGDWSRAIGSADNQKLRPKSQYFRIWTCNREELTGLFLIMLITGGAVVLMPISVVTAILTNLDPLHPILEDYIPAEERNWILEMALLIFRFMVAFLCCVEGARFLLLVLLLISSLGLVMEKLIRVILLTQDLYEALQKYQLFWLQYYLIKIPINNLLAIGTLIGFSGGTAMIWLSFNGWKYVTPFLAVLFPILSVWIILVLLVGISAQVSLVDKSKTFTCKWRSESLMQTMWTRKEIRRCKMLGKTLRSLPVACSSCCSCSINSNTPFSFLQILMKAVTDSLLGIKM